RRHGHPGLRRRGRRRHAVSLGMEPDVAVTRDRGLMTSRGRRVELARAPAATGSWV
uniref:Uncharacterized protein n=1 Tax=Aegilops tauschii subsp. strangulata TaxID=200361 RepID=A0A453QIA2_AEGTS